jgi:hypothetical protein
MASNVWSWFKKAAHWIAVGAEKSDQFLLAVQQSNLINLIPGIGPAINTGLGILEKILAGNSAVEQVSASLSLNGVNLTSAQKLAMATPDALKAFVAYANAAGMKITDMSKATQIASATASLGADFLNILEPLEGAKLPVPNTPAAPPAQTVAPSTK